MAVKYEVVATIGTYTNKGGEKKYISRKVGSLIETQHGDALKLDACFNPAGCKVEEDGSVWLKLFAPKPATDMTNPPAKAPKQNQPTGFNSFDDELNF